MWFGVRGSTVRRFDVTFMIFMGVALTGQFSTTPDTQGDALW